MTRAGFAYPPGRLALGAAIALAAAGPIFGGLAVPTHTPATTAAPSITPAGPCPNGEDTDPFTGTCVPHLVPRSPLAAIPGNPDIPSVRGVPCVTPTRCIGLTESEAVLGPRPVPHAKVGHEPTGVTSHP